ncbi:hypothetical protein VE01_07356 [Pseudogymnoascus verrucosus]|uniref:Uncharacterized protein n=1 Tax=Pseudogymnoascus verrucosus TaxID=342668 RepID=A0A1B8GGW6_9PEZI|nr:uncharacterized protein VE01_07356 [Pseudogymnoascus verrucosus]OBT95053.1 hypothetical protein VE01_07356 [Pseudogymnoascus verrucosus]
MEDDSDIVPGGGSSRPASSPIVLAGMCISGLCRPGRLRGRLAIALLISMLLATAYMVRGNTDHIKNYVSSSLSSGNSKSKPEESKWGIGGNNSSSNGSIDGNKFVLIIPVRRPSVALCKTLVSAAILNYPPPTLIGYGNDNGNEADGGATTNTLNFLLSRQIQDGDLALVVDERTWFQLPGQVMVDRFDSHLQRSNAQLLAKYGAGKFKERILFGAEKSCIDHKSEDTACYASPLSPIPKDVYGPSTDVPPASNYRPRYLYSPNMMGRAGDLRDMLQYAQLKLDTRTSKESTQYLYSEIFGDQELKREKVRRDSLGPISAFKEWLIRNNPKNDPQTLLGIEKLDLTNTGSANNNNPDFGIGLDYSSSIFQVLDNSVDDIQFVTFNHPTIVNSPSRISASKFSQPIYLPQDLNSTAPPFKLHSTPVQGPVSDLPLLEVDKLPVNKPWADVALATNIIVPGTEIPSSMSLFGAGTPGLEDKWWKKMWYQPKARALMRRYMRSYTGHIAAEAAARGGEYWWDFRGGKGGIWTDKGEFLEWQEVCGQYDEAVFGDKMGKLGEEDKVAQPVYNKFGKIIADKSPQ